MPRKFMFTRDEIITAALKLVKTGGISALTARALGTELGSSSRPIFGLFKNMEEVQQEVLKAANVLYQSYLKEDMQKGIYPPYKASGMAYMGKKLSGILYGADHFCIDNIPQVEYTLCKRTIHKRESTGKMLKHAK